MTDYVVSSGQASSGIVVNSGDSLTVLSGGVVSGATVNFGGIEYISAGGVATYTRDNSGIINVLSGGLSISTTLMQGWEDVSSGGIDSGTTIDHSQLTVLSGGTAIAATVLSGGEIAAGARYDTPGTVIGAIINSGGFVEAGLDTGTIINSGGREEISVGATASATVVNNGGTQIVGGGFVEAGLSGGSIAVGTVVNSGGAVIVKSGGLTIAGTIAGGGTETISGYGAASAVDVSSGGTVQVLSGGTLYDATVAVGATIVVSSGGVVYNNGTYVVDAGQTASGLVLVNGDSLTVLAGGIVDSVTVSSGGTANVSSGGVISGLTIDANGVVDVLSGGVVNAVAVNVGDLSNLVWWATQSTTFAQSGIPSSTTFSSGFTGTLGQAGVLEVSSGGFANAVVVNGGTADVQSGGILSGGAISGYLASGMALEFLPHTSAFYVPVSAFIPGFLTVASGGSASAVEVAAGGTVIAAAGAIVACFAAGTNIATATGESPVEHLTIGTRVRSSFGGTVPVQWIGERDTDCRRHPRPWDVWPVRVVRHAFAPNQPARDLLLSPDHAVYVDGHLVPVRYLLNGASICQEEVDRVHYFHVELPTHDVIFADGLPVESYLDTGNRAAFTNGGETTMLHPDFALQVWQSNACAPLLRTGAGLTEIRERLLARAAELGFHQTDDADLHLLIGGKRIDPVLNAERATFTFHPTNTPIILSSRIGVPAWLCAEHQDHRRLGVSVAGISVDGQNIALGACVGSGWHAAEGGFRWTDGAGTLHIPGASG